MQHPAFHHETVLRGAVTELLGLRPGGRWLDGTLGGGGHSEAILDGTGPDGLLVGIDRDRQALAAAGARLSRFGDRAVLLHGRYGDMAALGQPWAPFDGVVLDIGTSSPQLDHPERGFSFMRDGPLDMRMDPADPESAADLLDTLDEAALTDLLFRYGEEPHARRIARAILNGRPWRRTLPLAECIAKASGWKGSRTHPATRTFQALRIAVNDELGELERGLEAALGLLRPGGRLAVISFHSLEDRIVKRRLREAAGKDAPRDAYGYPLHPAFGRLITPQGIGGAEADPTNPRARSARLRVFERAAAVEPGLGEPAPSSPSSPSSPFSQPQ